MSKDTFTRSKFQSYNGNICLKKMITCSKLSNITLHGEGNISKFVHFIHHNDERNSDVLTKATSVCKSCVLWIQTLFYFTFLASNEFTASIHRLIPIVYSVPNIKIYCNQILYFASLRSHAKPMDLVWYWNGGCGPIFWLRQVYIGSEFYIWRPPSNQWTSLSGCISPELLETRTCLYTLAFTPNIILCLP